MNGFDKLHKQQDDFIKNTLQEDEIVNQPLFDNFSNSMNKTNIKVKKYSYKQRNIIIILLLLLIISFCFNIYLTIVKQTPITITTIFETAKEKISSDDDISKKQSTIFSNSSNNSSIYKNENAQTSQEQNNPTLTPNLFTDINTNEVEEFVNQFAIGINKLNLEDTANLESNTILLHIAQQFFSSKSSVPTSLNIDTSYASSSENFHRFLSEFTINNYLNIDYLKSYNNYIGYVSRSDSYIYGKDYLTLEKEIYTCNDVTITDKTNNIYTAQAKVTRTYENEISTYLVTFSFKVNSNYKYQKYKLLSLSSQLTSGNVENKIHLVNN